MDKKYFKDRCISIENERASNVSHEVTASMRGGEMEKKVLKKTKKII